MAFVPLSLDYDARLRAHALFATTDYGWYLAATRGAEKNLKIQRDIIKGRRAYETLRHDIRRGCLLPPIVLAVQSPDLPQLGEGQIQGAPYVETLDLVGRVVSGVDSSQVQIVDGLQRTNALREAEQDLFGVDLPSFLANRLRVEVWLNIPLVALAYRMLLLNAGQRPMSMKHQIEILSANMATELAGIRGLEILQMSDHKRRVRPGQFHLARITELFQAWLQGQPNIDLRNLIAEQIISDEAVEALGAGLASEGAGVGQGDFVSFVQWLIDADFALGPEQIGFLQHETVLQGVAAAVGEAQRNAELRVRLDVALEKLLNQLRATPGEDPFAITEFNRLRLGIDPKRYNIGEATRDLVFRGFKDYIYYSGETPMRRCWTVAASAI